jgi:signal peptidase I
MISHRSIKRIKPKSLISEARFLLRKKGHRLDENARNEIEQAISSVEDKAKSGTPEEVIEAKELLHDAIIKHLPRRAADTIAEFFRALVTAIIIALVVRQFIIEPFEIPSGSMTPTLKKDDKILVSKFNYGLNIPFINAKIFAFHKPQRWDVVVFTTRNIKDASDVERNFVKRVVGLPGETIMIENGEIYKFEPDEDNNKIKTLVPKPEYLKALEPDYCFYQNFAEGKTSDIVLFDTSKRFGIFPVSVPNGDKRMVSWKYGFRGQKIKIPPGHYFVLGDNSMDSFDSRGWGFVPFENIRGRVVCKWKFMPPWGDGIVR